MGNTAKQEDCSILFLRSTVIKKFKLSDKQYAEWIHLARSYPQANAVWREEVMMSKLLDPHGYMISRSIPTVGWSGSTLA